MIELTQANEDLLDTGDKLLLFWASWALPAKPALEEARKRNDIELLVSDVDEQPLMAHRFDVRGVPTLVLMHNGKEVKRKVGWDPERTLQELFSED
jgi:thioredoxin-like negative regulator of GroEL